jgi:hypothetical protein
LLHSFNLITLPSFKISKRSTFLEINPDSNSDPSFFRDQRKFLPSSLETLIQQDFEEYEKKKKAADEIKTTVVEEKTKDGIVTTTTTTTTTTKVETVVNNKITSTDPTTKDDPSSVPVPDKPIPTDNISVAESDTPSGTITPAAPNADPPQSSAFDYARESTQRGYNKNNNNTGNGNYGDSSDAKKEEEKGKVNIPHDDSNSVYVGLRVYTRKDVPAVIVGRLKKATDKSSTNNTDAQSDKGQ